jgi:hypothetical protein
MASSSKPRISLGQLIELHLESRGDRGCFVSEEGESLTAAVGVGVEACHAFPDQNAFRDQFVTLLSMLGRWAIGHRGRWSELYLGARGEGLSFVVVLSGPTYDGGLESSLTDLDLRIANDERLPLLRLGVLTVPKTSDDSRRSFLPGPAIRILLHGNGT